MNERRRVTDDCLYDRVCVILVPLVIEDVSDY